MRAIFTIALFLLVFGLVFATHAAEAPVAGVDYAIETPEPMTCKHDDIPGDGRIGVEARGCAQRLRLNTCANKHFAGRRPQHIVRITVRSYPAAIVNMFPQDLWPIDIHPRPGIRRHGFAGAHCYRKRERDTHKHACATHVEPLTRSSCPILSALDSCLARQSGDSIAIKSPGLNHRTDCTGIKRGFNVSPIVSVSTSEVIGYWLDARESQSVRCTVAVNPKRNITRRLEHA